MINWKLVQEFKPALLFVGKFVILYIGLNLIYGAYVNSFESGPDLITKWVTNQTSILLNSIGEITYTQPDNIIANQYIFRGENTILAVYEGCNGVNTMIVFISFLLAYGRFSKKLFWFIPIGVIIIHLFNLVRIGALYFVVIYLQDYLYFTHKYLFTAFLFAVIFLLWIIWVQKLYPRENEK